MDGPVVVICSPARFSMLKGEYCCLHSFNCFLQSPDSRFFSSGNGKGGRPYLQPQKRAKDRSFPKRQA
ncbi:hypothetical protein AtNW77_Chr5g0085521 [Arabidopsis thaliana]